MNETARLSDTVSVALGANRGHQNPVRIDGLVIAEMFGPDGELKSRVVSCNLVTAVGDQMYAGRGSGIGSPAAAPTGMRLGTGANSGGNAPSKTGAGAALTTYLSGSNKAWDATYPQAASGVATYRVTWAAGEATTASAITEAVIVNDTIATNATSSAANTISRVAIAGVGSKGASDTLQITWTHTLLGA